MDVQICWLRLAVLSSCVLFVRSIEASDRRRSRERYQSVGVAQFVTAGRVQSTNQKYPSCAARIGVGSVLVNGALQVRLNSRSLAVAIFPVNKSQTALETHVVNSNGFVAFAQRRNVNDALMFWVGQPGLYIRETNLTST